MTATPMFEVIETPDDLRDDAPLTTETVGDEYPDKCVVCSAGIPYGGKGPRPKYCDEHKKNKSKTSPRVSARGAEATARTAAGLLGQLNGLIGMGLAMYGLKMTAETIQTANDQFVEQATIALTNDPKLAKKIVGLGATSGKASLAVAYGMLGASIAPVAMFELKQKKAEQDALVDSVG